MQRRITWTIFFSVLVLIAAFTGVSYYFQNIKEKAIRLNQENIEKNFSDFSVQKKKLSVIDGEISLIATGDISYSRAVGRMVAKQKDNNYPFLKVRDYLKSADLVFGNLETPITEGREIPDFDMVFRSNPGTENALAQAGFSIVSLANNHTPNFGEKGLKNTFKYLDEAGIKYVGAGKNTDEANSPVYIEIKGIKFAFLAYNDSDVVPASYEASETNTGTAFMRVDKMTESVKTAKEKADFVIVSMHSGIEYVGKPNNRQINFAHTAIDAGADLIIGHHPHVVQTVEQYKGKYIFYSLGNFVFDQPQSQNTKEGLTIKVYFKKSGISKIILAPIVMESFAEPQQAMDESKTKNILKRLNFPFKNDVAYIWDGVSNSFQKTSIPVISLENIKNSSSHSKKEMADLNNNSVQEAYTLENGQLVITENSKLMWQSPRDWWIDNFVLADSNNDGVKDINLSVWKSGDFGTSKPFWIKENDVSIKNHFFIFDLVGTTMKSVWQSSNLEMQNCDFTFADIDGDGKNDLITLESNYDGGAECNGNYISVWKWNGWGFSNEWRSERGNFSNIKIERKDEKNLIVVDSF